MQKYQTGYGETRTIFDVGDHVRVYSTRWECWFNGHVTHVNTSIEPGHRYYRIEGSDSWHRDENVIED